MRGVQRSLGAAGLGAGLWARLSFFSRLPCWEGLGLVGEARPAGVGSGGRELSRGWAPGTAMSPSADLRLASARRPSPARRAPPAPRSAPPLLPGAGEILFQRAGRSEKQQETAVEGAGQRRRAFAASCGFLVFLC